MAELNFKADDYEAPDPDRPAGGDFQPLPEGWYCFRAIASELRQNKSGAGSHVWFEFEIVENAHPKLAGRKTWTRFNYVNASEKAQQIGRSELRALRDACGQTGEVKDSEHLHGYPVALRLVVRAAQGGFKAQNEILGYRHPKEQWPDGVVATPEAAATGAESVPAEAGAEPESEAKKAPWE